MKVIVLDAVLDDLEEGYYFYEKQAAGLGVYFLDTMWSDIDSLAYFVGIHFVTGNYFRMLAHRFPHSIYYQMEVSVIVDNRRNPQWITDQLSNR